jgi:hypothetical protein
LVPEFAPERILAVLAAHDVRYVVIGGYAAALHGSPFLTQDVDITPEATSENLARLSAALKELDARIRAAELDEPLPFSHDADSLAAVQVWNLTTRYGDLDISFVPGGTQGYADLNQDATDELIDNVAIRLVSLADIIRSKQAANRPKDQRVLPTLRELLASRYEKGSGGRQAEE